MELAKAGKFEQARASFALAYMLSPDPSTLWNLALAEMKSGHAAEAIRHLKTYLRGPAVDPAYAAKAPKLLEQLSARVGHINVEAPAGTDLTVDGDHLPERAPLGEPVDVAPGAHVVEGKLGARPASASVTVVAGETVLAALTFAPPATGPDPAQDPRAPVARGAPFVAPVDPHQARAAEASQPTSRATFWTTGHVVGLSLGVAAVAAAGASLAFASASNGHEDDARGLHAANPGGCADRASAVCGAESEALAQGQSARTMSQVFLVGAGVLGAAGVIAFVAWPESTRGSTLRVVPGLGRGIGLVRVEGTF